VSACTQRRHGSRNNAAPLSTASTPSKRRSDQPTPTAKSQPLVCTIAPNEAVESHPQLGEARLLGALEHAVRELPDPDPEGTATATAFGQRVIDELTTRIRQSNLRLDKRRDEA
jgi:hypothetical protein